MKSRASSFRADRAPLRWYREPWPWLLMSGPFVVVVAGLCTAWLAYKSDDGLVANDYYKQGLAINRKIARAEADRSAGIGASIAVTASGLVLARIEGLGDAPPEVRLTLARTHESADAEVVLLRRDAEGDYVGSLTAKPAGRWIVTLESRTWRLPTTITDRLSGVRLGAAERRPAETE
jgi:hypothetical protein